MKRNNKNIIKPDVVRGGKAIPLGNNYYYMKGRTHSQGGIDIGKNPKTGIEVEDGEVMHLTNQDSKIFSAQPIINNESPAQLVMGGVNPTKVFNQQERFKDINNLNDDGTKQNKYGGNMKRNKKATGGRNILQPIEDIQSVGVNPNLTPSINMDGLSRYRTPDLNSNVANEGSWFNRNIAPRLENFTAEDGIGLASNTIGSIAGGIINNRALNRMRYRPQPIQNQANKLRTDVNINPQLDNIRENLGRTENLIRNNTGSSRNALARTQEARLNATQNANSLLASRENQEISLVNQDRNNQQAVANSNINQYNNWIAGQTDFNNSIIDRRADNAVGTMESLNVGVQDTISRSERRENARQTTLATMAANPNVNPRILKEMGVKGITDKMVADWDKVYGARNQNNNRNNTR